MSLTDYVVTPKHSEAKRGYLPRYILLPVVLLAVFLNLAFPAASHAQAGISLIINGESIDSAPIMVAGQAMVPLRSIAEALDMKVSFDSQSRLVLVDTHPAPEPVGGPGIGLWVRGKEVVPGIQPQIIDGRLMVSLCTVTQAFEVRADWDEQERLVWLSAGRDPIYYRDRAVVLMYHHFADWERDATITAARFASHLEMLGREGFNVVALNQITDFLGGRGNLPPNAVAITMDDGYESVYTLAYPLLKERGWPATVFMIVADVGTKNTVWLPKLDWEQIKEMGANGITFYSHTYNSHYYTQDSQGQSLPALVARRAGETEDVYLARVFHDLGQAQEKLVEHLGREVDHFSPPYGKTNEQVLELARRVGHKYVWTIEPKPVTRASSLDSLGRVNAGSPKIGADDLKSLILQTAAN